MSTAPPTATAPVAAEQRGNAPRAWAIWALIFAAALAFAMIRVMSVNLPWHLATGRFAHETGHWPAVNTFSYTHPDYPIYQQYPAFQWTMWAIFRAAGWAGLSFATGVGWVIAFFMIVRWGGPLRQGAAFHVLWIFGLWALQRRMILRPDLFTMLAFCADLLALDAFMRGKTRALAVIPIVHLVWVNSHQLWFLSLALQTAAIADLFRRGDRRRARLALMAFGACLLLTLATPLGVRIFFAPLRTAQSLEVFRPQVEEFHRIWTMPYELNLALLTGVPAAFVLWRTRRATPLFDWSVWLITLGLLLLAVRGLMFFGVVSAAIVQRCVVRTRAAGGTLLPPLGAPTRRVLGLTGLAVTLLGAGGAVYYRWVRPPLSLGGTQPGLGRAVGGWSEAATDFIRGAPPPGRMLNLGMGLGDAVIFWVPGIPVFVDSRLESYPPDFLRAVLAAQSDDGVLASMIQRYDARWLFLNHARPILRDRVIGLLRAGWRAVHVDSANIVLVQAGPTTEAYLRDHAIDLRHARPNDLVAEPALRKQQEGEFAALMAALDAAGLR